jgi:hypothetical protein
MRTFISLIDNLPRNLNHLLYRLFLLSRIRVTIDGVWIGNRIFGHLQW